MSNYNIQVDYSLCSQASPYLFNHPEHKITVSISDKNYKTSYRSNVRWDFGDGYIVEAPTATHYYSSSGYYNIQATLYGTDGTIHNDKVTSVQILVKPLISTALEFVRDKKQPTWDLKKDCLISKNLFLGKIQITLDSDVISEPKILAHRRDFNGTLNEASYFEVKDKPYYHLNRYYTFLEESSIFMPDLSSSVIKVLTPVKKYSPSYLKIFAVLSEGKTLPKITYYYVADNIVDDISYNFCSDEIELPEKAFECGKVGIFNVWYKNDNENTNELIFEIEKGSLKLINESTLDESYLNIPPLGFQFNTIDNKELAEKNCIKALSNNGLYSNLTNEEYKIDTYLKHNFYKNYLVEGYYSFFIKNDLLDNMESYTMFKSKYLDENSLVISSNKNECIITPISTEETYYKKYSFKPLTSFALYNNNEIIYSCNELKDLSEIILPSEKQHKENLDKILETYMSHPVFEETPVFKTFLKDSLGNNGLFDRIINKGLNFIDDHSNIKTCYINKLLDIYKMMDEPINDYTLSSFEKINELKDLMRILSMNYSNLFGNIIEDDYDISINHLSNGKNVGDKFEKNTIFLCDKNYNLIGFREGDKIHQLKSPEKYIIIKDDFSFKTYLASFYGIDTTIIELFDDQTDNWKTLNENFIEKTKFAYSLDNYTYKWGWGLKLPEEFLAINSKSELIDNFYSFYIFNSQVSKSRKYNFLEESTIPLDKEGNQLSVDEWNDKFGFTYDCLMKVLCEKLNDIK